jgi:hypothetical protein
VQRDQDAVVDLLVDRFETIVMQLAFFRSRRTIVAVHVANGWSENVNAGCNEVVDIFGGCEECCDQLTTRQTQHVTMLNTFQISSIRNAVLTTFYPPTLCFNRDSSTMAFLGQDHSLLEICGFVVMRHVHHY